MSEDLDHIIKEKENEFIRLQSRMEELRLQFINDTIIFTQQWYEEMAKHYVTKYSNITLSFSKEKLAKMKAKVKNLVLNSEKIVKDALSDKKIWWHQDPILHASFSLYEQLGNVQIGNKYPRILDKPIRRALGELGAILEEYGYNVTTRVFLKSSYREFWFISEEEGTEAPPYFPHLLDWSEEMQETLRKYNVLFKRAIVLLNEIQVNRDEKKKRQIASLWDSG